MIKSLGQDLKFDWESVGRDCLCHRDKERTSCALPEWSFCSPLPLAEFELSCDEARMGDLNSILEYLMDIEQRLVQVRTAYRFSEHTSATWSMYSKSAYCEQEKRDLAIVPKKMFQVHLRASLFFY